MEFEHNMKIKELREFIDNNYATMPDKYITRVDLLQAYTNHVTCGQMHPHRKLASSEFTRLMNIICAEKGLLYKKSSGRYVYWGLTTEDTVRLHQEKERQQKIKKKAQNAKDYATHSDHIKFRNSIDRWIDKYLFENLPYDLDRYKLLKTYKKVVIVPKDPSKPLPWKSRNCSILQDISVLVHQHVDLEESIKQTYILELEWRKETNQLSEEEQERLGKEIFTKVFYSLPWGEDQTYNKLSRKELQDSIKWEIKNAIQQYMPVLTDRQFERLWINNKFDIVYKKPYEELPWNDPNFTDIDNLCNLIHYHINFYATLENVTSNI